MPCLRCLFLAQTAATLSLEEVTDQLDDDAPCSAHGSSVAAPSLLSVEEQRAVLVATLQRLRQAGSALRRAHSQVQKREREVADLRQTASQQEARLTNLEHLHGAAMQELEQQLRIVQTQAEEIRELSAPPIEVGTGVLAVPLIGKLDRERADYVTQHILSTVQKQHVRRVILDLTGLREADAQAARALLRIHAALTLIGAQVTLCGIAARTAQALVAAGADLRPLSIAATLRIALQQG